LWWWCTPVIPASQEAEVGGSPSKAGPRKKIRDIKQNKLKPKGLEEWLKW
jgi:hypothetical protein